MTKRVFIIAEAGVNHNGDIVIAKKLIDAAKEAGADAVKFQTFKAESLVSKFASKAEYQMRTTDVEESQLEMIRKLELSDAQFRQLKDYCQELRIEFLSSPFDLESVCFLDQLGLATIKIPSGEITNYPYLKTIGMLKKKIILSTGMSNMEEIQAALKVLIFNGADKGNIIVLQCNTEYPTPMSDVNLRGMLTIREECQVEVGYSDHTIGIEVSIAAVALGAAVIEKHLTLDRQMLGPDHAASLESSEFKDMVKCIRNIEVALGQSGKQPTKSEIKNQGVARKSIVAEKNICQGDLLTAENMTTKRPGMGLSPMLWEGVVGQRAKKNFIKDEYIQI